MKYFLAILVSVILASAGLAEAKTRVVNKGDTLSGIAKQELGSASLVAEIMKVNPQIKKARHIEPGWEIKIPDISAQGKKAEKVEKTILSASKKRTVARKVTAPIGRGTRENPAIYTDAEVGDDPWRGDVVNGLKLLGLDIPKNADLRFAFEGMEVLPVGAIIHMVSGKDKEKWYQADLSPEKAKVRRLGLIINGKYSGSVYLKPECANWLTWVGEPPAPVIPSKPIIQQIPPPQAVVAPEPKTPKYLELACPDCAELEAMAGVSVWVNNPGDHYESTGKNFWAEMMYWDNFEQDCSSNLWYGFGFIGSYYDYQATHLPSEGDGWRLAGEVGLKGFHSSDIDEQGLEYSSSWQVKGRLGWEESDWRNPETKKGIHQEGPVFGLYGEYVRELVDPDTLTLIVQAEFWNGFSQKISGPIEWNLETESRAYFSSFIGLDWQFADRWTLRAGPGYNWQGWDREDVFAPQAQLMYDLPDDNGRLAFGVYGQFYSHLSPTFGLLGRYESGNLLRKAYGDHRASQYQFVGMGIEN